MVKKLTILLYCISSLVTYSQSELINRIIQNMGTIDVTRISNCNATLIDITPQTNIILTNLNVGVVTITNEGLYVDAVYTNQTFICSGTNYLMLKYEVEYQLVTNWTTVSITTPVPCTMAGCLVWHGNGVKNQEGNVIKQKYILFNFDGKDRKTLMSEESVTITNKLTREIPNLFNENYLLNLK